jgi:GH25 family lysozyme M1 (1,4-beta-N-acetylmuramidase)
MIFNSTRKGHDISTYQDDPTIAGSVNFDQMVASGASFVIMRSSVGNLLDVDFQTYKNNSRGKLPRAIYHYYWNTISPVIQAQRVLSAIGGEKFEGRVWLDLETTGTGAYSRPANWRAFMQIIEDAGYRTGIYTGYPWWKNNA